MMRHWLSVSAIALTVGLLAPALPGLASTDPTAVISELGTQGIQVLGPHVPVEQRWARFRALFQEDFDIPDIGRFVLGRYWRELTPAQQQQFLRLFQEYTVRSYSDRLGRFGGTSFQVTGSTERGEEAVVASEFDRVGKPPVQVDWHLVNLAGSYKITDVDVDGVSMKLSQREAFATMIENNNGRADTILPLLSQQLAATG